MTKSQSYLFSLCLLFSLSAVFLLPSPSLAHHILFYFNDGDGTDGALLQCVTILQNAGNQVTAVDVGGRNRDPRDDNWGAPYDQVWDMRFVDPDSNQYGAENPTAADYFNENWRSKAVSFLNHCGKLFIAAEHYPVRDRDDGLYPFLEEIDAVKSGFDRHAPSAHGNSSTSGEAFYPVRRHLGPVSFYGAWVGGIPLAYLNGISFVDTDQDWEGDDVDRSIVSGWERNELGGAVTAGICGRGKLFMVWDATMWTLWQPGMYDEGPGNVPVWDDSAWVPGNIQSPASTIMHVKAAKKATNLFFPAVAHWLGDGGCPCTEASPPLSTAGSQTMTPPTAALAYRAPPLSVPLVKVGSFLTAAKQPSTVITSPTSNSAVTVTFTAFPINLYMGFRDGAGEYQLNIWDFRGQFVQTVFSKNITTEKETWATWDGKNSTGAELPLGFYTAVLSKDSRFLRKIILARIRP